MRHHNHCSLDGNSKSKRHITRHSEMAHVQNVRDRCEALVELLHCAKVLRIELHKWCAWQLALWIHHKRCILQQLIQIRLDQQQVICLLHRQKSRARHLDPMSSLEKSNGTAHCTLELDHNP